MNLFFFTAFMPIEKTDMFRHEEGDYERYVVLRGEGVFFLGWEGANWNKEGEKKPCPSASCEAQR